MLTTRPLFSFTHSVLFFSPDHDAIPAAIPAAQVIYRRKRPLFPVVRVAPPAAGKSLLGEDAKGSFQFLRDLPTASRLFSVWTARYHAH